MPAFVQEIRCACRMFLRNPAVAVVAILALALGTGANSAIFSVVYAALLRPLPVRNVDRLVSIAMVSEKLRVSGAQPGLSAYWKYRRDGRFHDSIAAAAPGTATFASGRVFGDGRVSPCEKSDRKQRKARRDSRRPEETPRHAATPERH